MKCNCQDSEGTVCGVEMTKREQIEDGFCSYCSDNLFEELQVDSLHQWFHKDNPKHKGVTKCL